MSSRLCCRTSAGESSGMPESRTSAGSTVWSSARKFPSEAAYSGGLDVEVPPGPSPLVDGQPGIAGQKRVGDELSRMDLPIRDSDAQMGCEGAEEPALHGGTVRGIRPPGDPQHPGKTVGRLGDGDLEVESEFIDGHGSGDLEAMGAGQFSDRRLTICGHAFCLSALIGWGLKSSVRRVRT